MRRDSAAMLTRNSAKRRRSISTIFSSASRTLVSYSFNSGVVKRSAPDQGLLALVVGGSMLQVGLADLNVKAEDVVELDLERVDAGALAFALLDLRDVVLAVAADVAQFVELRIEPALDDSAIVEGDGRLGNDAALDALANVGEFVEPILAGRQSARPAKCASARRTAGSLASDAARARMSRGFAVSRVMRLSRRSMSRMPSSERRSSSR